MQIFNNIQKQITDFEKFNKRKPTKVIVSNIIFQMLREEFGDQLIEDKSLPQTEGNQILGIDLEIGGEGLNIEVL